MEVVIPYQILISPTASLRKRDLASLVLTLEIIMLMEHLYIQDFLRLLFWLKDMEVELKIGLLG
jgi:hypothetical protein